MAVFVLLLFAGCGDSAESLMKQQIADMNAVADAVEAGKSESETKVIFDRMAANGEKLNKMQISDAEKKRLAEKYASELKSAGMRMSKAMMSGAETMMQGMVKGLGDAVPSQP
jgi:CTP-dependent riboflavin kinase